MPDWLIHMGTTHALGRPVARFDVRWLLLGSVLPDAIPRGLGMAIHRVPALDALASMELGLYLGFLHTPFSVALLIAALVVVAVDRRAAASGLAFGAGLHFAFDLLQRSFGSGTSIAYPFELGQRSLQVGWYESPVTFVLVPVCGVYLLVAWLRATLPRDPALRLTRSRLLACLVPVLVCFTTPLLCIDRAVDANLGNAQLALHPEAWEGKPVQIAVASIEEVDGDLVFVEKADTMLGIRWGGQQAVGVGDFISLRGTFYRAGVEPTEVFVHSYGFKSLASLLGLVLLLGFWGGGRFRGRRADRS